MQNEEKARIKVVWKGTPSHWAYFPKYLVVGLLAVATIVVSALGFVIIGLPVLLIVALYALYLYMDIRLTNYTLTEEALLRKRGVFNRKTDELMLYRIQDISLEEPFFLRLVRLSNLKLYAIDKVEPVFHLTYIQEGEKIRKAIRKLSEKQRGDKGVRPVDIVR